MAEIRFQILNNANATSDLFSFGGSGLAFYGSSAGSSVQIGSYQDNTYVANADGSDYDDATNNIKYVANTWPSGQCQASLTGGSTLNVGLSGIKSFQSTLGIEFGHTTAVKTQNVQLRIYDRTNINYPASGVNTKVAELINHDGSTYAAQGSAGVSSNAVGSGDCFWWGEAWPTQYVSQNYFTNSSGETFRNGLQGQNVNGDSRLTTAGSYATVGGTGVVVPLSNSPGSGQKQLNKASVSGSEGMIWPKWTQYVTNTSNQTAVFGAANSFGDGSTAGNRVKNYGGTGIDTHHTWAVALSASPLSIGSKEQYGLYISLEYL
jgi:hypothetical protein